MRVLLCTLPQRTHFLTMVPLAWALRTAGHEVRVASLPRLTDLITDAGLTAVPVGRDVDVERMDRPEDRAQWRRGLPKPYDLAEVGAENVDWAELTESHRAFTQWGHRLHNQPMMADLVRLAQQWRPDLVLWEPNTFAGAIAAKACGAAHGRLLFTMDVYGVTHAHIRQVNSRLVPPERDDALAEWLESYARRYGFAFTEDLVSGQFTVDQLSPSLRIGAPLHYVPMRHIPYGGRAVVPPWVWAPRSRPRVALTLGLSATDHFDGYTLNVADVLDSLADLDVEVVATIAAAEQPKLPRVPDNVRVVDYVPLHALAPTCAAVVNHGGFGTLSTVARYGVPQLVLPFHFEGPLLAGKLAAQGAGLVVQPGAATGATVREQLGRLLDEPVFRERAEALRAEIEALPTPNEVAGQLVELTAKYRAG
ncbi:activator-dependent family glycosyltransferase [Micromonospora sp. WMMD998]|uniref:activator-dependent family glycosyltransferase n=1 Tax=Micromonospora sp. WMMD998 TaxID=3016092 RepID=UPI00249BCCE0|nr:activator-dependent family glycosyltransferase [Micromonospora sp. WMMD998]WFE40991.1 activator-dependent family glycosyltransferase [Micromonospora sp. WMMD998]